MRIGRLIGLGIESAINDKKPLSTACDKAKIETYLYVKNKSNNKKKKLND